MCEYCENKNYYDRKALYENDTTDIRITDENEIDIDYDEMFGWENMFFRNGFKIKYCPMCGRKLESEEE